MSSSNDFFSENIQVDLDDPGIWKAKGVKMDSDHRVCLIWAYLRGTQINEINVWQCRSFFLTLKLLCFWI
jgi:hypothetical protein